MKKIIILLLFILLIWFLVWFLKYQETDEGYVIASSDTGVWIIESREFPNPPDLKGKTPKEISEIYTFKGLTSDMPMANKLIHSKFRLGQKVRIYYTGGVYLRAPGDIAHPHLIVKLKE